MSDLTIVIPCLNDAQELCLTLNSLWDTVPQGESVQVVCVDDGSSRPIGSDSFTRIIRNQYRIGVGPSRHVGVTAAKSEYILLVDSHMRFTPGWYPALMERLAKYPKSIICGVCLGLQTGRMDPANPMGVYYGGSLNVCGPDRQKPSKKQVLEAIWNRGEIADDAEIPAPLGACYAMRRDWFITTSPLRHLRSWSMDEEMLGIKSWLHGGSVRLHKGVRIGHKFRLPTERVPFKIPNEDLGYNKLFAILTLTPEPLRTKLVNAYRSNQCFRLGMELIKKNWGLVLAERARNEAMFERDFMWLATRFGLALP